ncbi:phosphotransferase, partial [Frankia tisae]|uniref:phosphotransferase n=1 Tax=Frankia tisae TaxID=2950104 RepID=UPI0021BFA046
SAPCAPPSTPPRRPTAWDAALHAPAWQEAPVWIHGDLLPGNLLARDGRLRAVIDFGGLGVGDPACDVMAAWTLLPAEERETFRNVAGVDDSTWDRGRGWALPSALSPCPTTRTATPPSPASPDAPSTRS